MDRLFLDANVLFAAAYRPDAGIRRLWDLAQVELMSSTYAVAEARRNLPRPEQVVELEALLQKVNVVSEASSADQVDVDLPEKDIPIISAARQAGASHLLTGDYRHFSRYYGKTLWGVMVLSPVEYLHGRS